jgi:hypothetical protein
MHRERERESGGRAQGLAVPYAHGPATRWAVTVAVSDVTVAPVAASAIVVAAAGSGWARSRLRFAS